MPSTYAHYIFGEKVLYNLDGEVKELIYKHLPLFHIGLHGPDILFYYKPLSSNPVNQTGHRIHEEPACSFFQRAEIIINSCTAPEAGCAYILGFICHFMLDSQCHPYIKKKTEETKLSHAEIETEFDRLLMVENNLNPLSYKPTGHIITKIEYAECISWFFEEINEEKILSSLKSMKRYLNFLVSPGKLKRFFIVKALKLTGNYENMAGLLMNYQPNPACENISMSLKALYSSAIIPTRDLINEFYENIHSSKSLNSCFQRNFV